MKKNKEKTPRKGISIGWKLILYFFGFTAVAVLVTWIFQVILLNTFFESSKRRELLSATKELAETISSETLSERARMLSQKGDMSILIYQIDDDGSTEVVNAGGIGREGFLTLSQAQIQDYRSKASKNGGSYVWESERSDTDPFESAAIEEGAGGRKRENRQLQCVTNLVDENGNSYLLYISTGLLPLSATVSTLKTQFFWIGGILLFCSLITVIFLYRRISKPLIRMNDSAKELAKGNYNVDFSGDGYRETRELGDTLNYAAHELSKSDQLQKELLANISHDLRTPLTMIRGYGEVMRDLPGENTPENMQVIIDETTRLSDLVNDLLDLSKLQSGVLAPNMQTFDLSELLTSVLARYETLTGHMGYKILLDHTESALISADAGMIQQVLYNLINNAINYTGEDQTVRVSLQNEGKTVRVSVTDTGVGIPKEEIENIWNRYYKIDKVHKRAAVGTGLGLSIVKNVLDLHHAAYGVNSTPGKGSTFWFELPVENREETKAE
ncbi:MAG: HAMP domain-containing histidine kinase [Clostridia bacterium]|nr:HAMP domain-containing histidine kinase [Clostridia bacterium]